MFIMNYVKFYNLTAVRPVVKLYVILEGIKWLNQTFTNKNLVNSNDVWATTFDYE